MGRRWAAGLLMFLCLAAVAAPALALAAQSPVAAQVDVHQLQQQLAYYTDRLDMTGFLVTSVLLFPMAAANAGHLAPYLGGVELSLESGLPLGLDAGGTYSESSFQFGKEDQLTLITDGVVEARSNTGELFGFTRTSAISVQPAESIAHAARNFGQEDDISVLSVTRTATMKAAIA